MAAWKKFSSEELRLARLWYNQDGKGPTEIAQLLHRDKASVTRRLAIGENIPPAKQGRKPILNETAVNKLEKELNAMVKKAAGNYEVTLKMLRAATRVKASEKVIQRELHKRGIYFYRFREKPTLTADDVKARMAFAEKYRAKTVAWWKARIQLHIDVKHFTVYLNGKARSHAAKEGARGAFRKAGQGLQDPYLKPSKKLKYNTGARGVKVLAGVGGGKVLVWEYIDGRKWTGKVFVLNFL